MLEKMMQYGYPPSVNKFRPEQIAHASTWDRVQDDKKAVAAMHRISILPSNMSTIAEVNPLDTGDELITWRTIPRAYGPVVPAGKMV